MKTTLYVLELENNKYYIGQTNQVTFRVNQHVSGLGSKWTMLHKPVKTILKKEIEVENARDAALYENWLTYIYMEKFGWENVRGGEFLLIENEKIQAKVNRIFDTETNKIRDFVKACEADLGKVSRYLYGPSNYQLVYILELEDLKFYIGSAKHLGKNLANQFIGKGNNWTRQFKPIRVREIHVVPEGENYRDLKERKRIEYKAQFGRDNVKGGNE